MGATKKRATPDLAAAGGCTTTQHPRTRRFVNRVMQQLPRAGKLLRKAQVEKNEQSSTKGLPMIVVNDRAMRDIAEDSWNALWAANEPPFVFQWGRGMADIVHDDRGQPMIRVLDKDALRGILDRRANFVKFVKVKDEDKFMPVPPPSRVVADMMAEREFGLPILRGIVRTPVFARNGELALASGYQPETGLYMHPSKGVSIPEVREHPGDDERIRARSLILGELLVDFPFVSDADRANAIALFLLPFVRLMIDGPTPLHMIESPSEGTGKGLLVRALLIPSVGDGVPTMTEGRGEEEWRKRITATLLGGPSCILIDNIGQALDSPALASALTAVVYTDRRLGQSQMVALPVTCAWVSTANNPAMSREIARRTIPIRIDARTERPWERKEFHHENLGGWANEHRGDLIWAGLTLVQAWKAEGRPLGTRTLGSYEAWAAVMGGILEVADVPGFLDNLHRAYGQTENDGAQWTEFCQVWWERFQGQPVGVESLYPLAEERSLLTHIWSGVDEHAGKTRLGVELSKKRDRVFGNFVIALDAKDGHTKALLYRLEYQEMRSLAEG